MQPHKHDVLHILLAKILDNQRPNAQALEWTGRVIKVKGALFFFLLGDEHSSEDTKDEVIKNYKPDTFAGRNVRSVAGRNFAEGDTRQAFADSCNKSVPRTYTASLHACIICLLSGPDRLS